MTLVLSSDSQTPDSARVEEHLASIVAPLGLRIQIVWVDRTAPEAEWNETLSDAYQNPWVWMAVAALISIGALAGLKALFWTLFWGTAAWFTSKFFIFLTLRRRMGNFSLLLRR